VWDFAWAIDLPGWFRGEGSDVVGTMEYYRDPANKLAVAVTYTNVDKIEATGTKPFA